MTDKDNEPKVMTLGIGGHYQLYDHRRDSILCYDNLVERYKLGRGLLPI